MIRKVRLEGDRSYQKYSQRTHERERGHSIAILWQQKELNYGPAVFTQVSDLIWLPPANKATFFFSPAPLLTGYLHESWAVYSDHDNQGVFHAYRHLLARTALSSAP